MPQTAFPLAQDLEEHLDSLGLIDDDQRADVYQRLRLDVKAAAAKATWEAETGFQPFLKDSADVTRYFEPQGSAVLDLGGGLLTLTSLKIGFSVTDPGTALTQDTQFWLEPLTAAVEGKPFTRIRFGWRQWGRPRSIQIIGRWGYAALVPDDVWNAVIAKACLLCYPELSAQVSRGLVGVRTQATDIRYVIGDVTPLSAQAVAWEDCYQKALLSYHRWEI